MVQRVTRVSLVLVMATAAAMAGGCSRSRAAANTWKVTVDPTGSCQVTTPPDWQLGRDFFLKREMAHTGPGASGSRRLPPTGLALWGIDPHDNEKLPVLPQGKRFLMRISLVRGESVCSVWRIKQSSDFTAEEKNTMRSVGKTLEVR